MDKNTIQTDLNPLSKENKIGLNNKWQDKTKIYIEVIGRKILVKLPKNDIDSKFLISIKYSKWEKQHFLWAIPNYPGNLKLIQNYFGERIYLLKIHNQMETNLAEPNIAKINKNDVNIDETLIVRFLRFLVIERKVSVTYQNQSINAIKFYCEKVLGGQRKFYFID